MKSIIIALIFFLIGIIAGIILDSSGFDEHFFSIFTMIIGGILGSILSPLGKEFVEEYFSRRSKSIGIHSALFFLLAANAIWVICEILTFSDLFSAALPRLMVAILFALSAVVLFIAFSHIPKIDGNNELVQYANTFKYLLLGNLCWITAETIEMIVPSIIEISSANADLLNGVKQSAFYVRILVTLGALTLYVKGVRAVYKEIPKNVK